MNLPLLLAPLRDGSQRALGAPLLLLLILSMMVVPLAPLALDLLFTFNIALSMVVLLSVVYVKRPLDFSAFPTVLLLTTLLRLSLNVASTRVVLLHGHEGPHAAGRVIESFGEFVVGGDYTVGFVVFIILTIINFVVVTKGAGRISEVSARFVLDAMPGRQMAIDADLNAGLLTREEAKLRRNEIRDEADFYGSMDGASKFIRGDAIAGLLVLFINITGGLLIGTLEHGLPFATALRNYTLLTIGDGLVAQVPALLVSCAVAVLVTRLSSAQDMSQQMARQVFAQPQVLGITAGMLGVIGLIPGMPHLPFLALAALSAFGARALARQRAQAAKPPPESPVVTPERTELSWEDVTPIDALGLEVGYRLIPLVDRQQNGELMARIKAVRKKLTQELGFLIPPVHVRDNLELRPNAYRILLSGVPVAQGEIHPDRQMALNPGKVRAALPGIATRDPAFGLDAVWIESAASTQAQIQGYTVVDPATVMATHLSQIFREHAHELLGHEEVQQLLNGLAKSAPKLVEDLVPKLLPLSALVRVLQGLLAERVPVRNLRLVAEALVETAPRSQDPGVLLAAARVALGRQIVQDISGPNALHDEFSVLSLAPPLERMLHEAVQSGTQALEPGLAERLHKSLSDGAHQQEAGGHTPVLLVPPVLRPLLARFTRHSLPALHVLAYSEVPESRRIRLAGTVA